MKAEREVKNPLIKPSNNSWEKLAAFNGSPFEKDGKIGLLYRAIGKKSTDVGEIDFSTVGYAFSEDGVNFKKGKQLIKPQYKWEKYGCEDPRITKIDDKYFIFYTALSKYPFCAEGIRVGVAITKDFKKFEKHPITPFNAKAMALFPEKINGKYAAILTVDSDRPPAKIVVAYFDKIEQFWSENYWRNYYFRLEDLLVPLQRDRNHHVELGAPPIKTDKGWLLIYSYIKNYFKNEKEFFIEAALLDINDPKKILGRTEEPLLWPEENYELEGFVPNIVFPSGALIKEDKLLIYYGGADTCCCVAKVELNKLLDELVESGRYKFKRMDENPLLETTHHSWEEKAVCNPAAVYLNGKIHLFYRATAKDDVSTIGYASSENGFSFKERSEYPVFFPREKFEEKGVEDPRVVVIGERLYMSYTGWNGNDADVCVSSISLKDLIKKNWNWSKPVSIDRKGVFDKNSCILPKKQKKGWMIFHRINNSITVSYVKDLDFETHELKTEKVLADPRENNWDSLRIGIGPPPIETDKGWLLIYHGISRLDNNYRVGAMLLDKENPEKILSRLEEPILEPLFNPNREYIVKDVVFPCGAVVIEDKIYLYYGEDDVEVSGATIILKDLLDKLIKEMKK